MIRKAVVAGQFYPGNKKELEEKLSDLMGDTGGSSIKKDAVYAVILPHAGYMYSGQVAADTLSSVELKDTLIILGPNHTGLGKPFSVMTEGSWQTPLGEVVIDTVLAQKIVVSSQYLKSDTLAHEMEHSIEVLLPFLQYAQKKLKFVPIVIARAEPFIYKQIARDIVRAIRELSLEKDVSIVASSDMTHYESQQAAQNKDNYAIESIIHLNADELLKRVEEKHITMCGVAPVAIMLDIVKELGATRAHLVNYRTSGDVTGDYDSVVGYAGIKIN